MRRCLLTIVLLLLVAASTLAAPQSPESFLGYKVGARFTPQEKISGYLAELARTTDLVSLHTYGESYEGRPLQYAVITSPENRQRIGEIRTSIAELNTPDRTSAARSAEIVRNLPAVTWLAFGIHGDESSSSEAAMMTAYRLTLDDEEARNLRRELVIIIDPLENPDGRERYINWFKQSVGSNVNPNPEAFEHFQPWPGGRYNHYLVDMNRDWAWATQKETRARIAAYLGWKPQVFVDMHEMGWESTYFFPPDANPINVNIDPETHRWLEVFGRGNADAFAERGWSFFVGERFDLFYPGYGDSWPSLRGAIGMTYEVAGGGRAGLAIRRDDATTLTLADRAERHYTTALATLRTAAANRQALLEHTWRSLKDHYDRAVTTYLLLPDAPNFSAAVETLQQQGLEVTTLRAEQKIRGTRVDNGLTEVRQFPAGTAVVRTKQPYGAIARSLLERSPVFAGEFLSEQRKIVDADQEDEFYDVTAWSIPIAMNVTAYATEARIENVAPAVARGKRFAAGAGRFGYLVDAMDPSVYKAAGRMLDLGVRFSVTTTELVTEGRRFSRGSLLIQRSNNGKELDPQLMLAFGDLDIDAVAVDTAWSEGVALGSSRITFVRDPAVAIVGGEGTTATSFGSLWYTLDVEAGIPHTVLPLRRLATTRLANFRVIILPDGTGYADILGKRGVERLQQWVRDGGTLIAIEGAGEFVRHADVGLSKAKKWSSKESKDEPEAKEDAADEAEDGTRYNDFRVPGAAFRTEMNRSSYLTFGVPSAPSVLVEGSDALLPLTHTVDNVLTITTTDSLQSGFAWPESIERLRSSMAVANEPAGNGRVITFVNDPHFRLYWKGTLPMFLNAVIYSPSIRR